MHVRSNEYGVTGSLARPIDVVLFSSNQIVVSSVLNNVESLLPGPLAF